MAPRELTDDEVFGATPARELTDEEVFAPPPELSDQEVFAEPQPPVPSVTYPTAPEAPPGSSYGMPPTAPTAPAGQEAVVPLREPTAVPAEPTAAPQTPAPYAPIPQIQKPSVGEMMLEPPGALTRGFVSGLLRQNPQMAGSTLEGMANLIDNKTAKDALLAASKQLQELGDLTPEEYAQQSHGIFASKSFDEALTAIAETAGAGFASTIPSLALGVAGGMAGGPAGALTGAGISSFVLNYGELYQELRNAKVGPEKAAKYALYASPITTLLDVASLGPIIGRFGGMAFVRRQLARLISRRILAEGGKGLTREAVTEAAQQVTQDAATSLASGRPFWTEETAIRAAEAGIGGAIVGGVLGGASGIVPDRPDGAPSPPPPEGGRREPTLGQPPPGAPPPPPGFKADFVQPQEVEARTTITAAGVPVPEVAPVPPQPAAPAEAPIPVQPRPAPRGRKPIGLDRFVAQQGGIRDDQGHDLRGTMGQKFVPGVGQLIRRSGKTVEELAEAATQEGYFQRSDIGSGIPTEAEFLDALDRAVRGERVLAAQDIGTEIEQQEAARLQEDTIRVEEARAQVQTAMEEIDLDATADEIDEAVGAYLEGVDPTDAIVAAVEQSALYSAQEAATEAGLSDIQIEEVPDVEVKPEQGRAGGVAAEAGAQPEAARAPAAEVEAERRPTGEGPAVERTEQGLQTVVPGAERISGEELGQRQAGQRIKAEAPQKAADEGLFDVAGRGQDELFATRRVTTQRGPVRTVMEFSDRLKVEREALGEQLRAELDRLGLPDVAVEVADTIKFIVAGQTAEADGRFLRDTITIALDAPDATATLHHEAIHAMRRMGLITEREYGVLKREAQRSWRKKYNIDKNYEGFSEDRKIEEAIAHAYTDWRAGRLRPTGTLRTALAKIDKFIQALRNALMNLDYQTVDDVFARTERGEVGGRPRLSPQAEETMALAAAYHGGMPGIQRFELKYIGTGEGAAAYGWGLYFASKRDVAEFYRAKLYRNRIFPIEKLRKYFKPGNYVRSYGGIDRVVDFREWGDGNWEAGVIEQQFRDGDPGTRELVDAPGARIRYHSTMPSQEQYENVTREKLGATYKVNLVPAEDEYLYWDKPLSEQSKKVRAALEARGLMMPDNSYEASSGGRLYQHLTKRFSGGKRGASRELNTAGIPGIKYLDQVSRAEGEGTYNYVIFDENLIEIEEAFAFRRQQQAFQVSVEALELINSQRTTTNLIRQAQQTAGLRDRVFNALSRPFAWYSPLAKLPLRKKYLSLRYKALGRIGRVDEIAAEIDQLFSSAPKPIQEQIHDFLTTRNANPATIQDATLAQEAVRVKNLINTVGDALVQRGMISQESRDAYRDEYLPRVYLKHLLGNENFRGIGTPKSSEQSYTKQRKDIPEDVRMLILGQITDPGFLASLGYAKPARDLAILDFLREVSREQEWIFPKTMVTFDGYTATAHYWKTEADRIRASLSAYPEKRRDAARQKADAMEAAAQPGLIAAPAEAHLFRQIPNSARYGQLRGMYVRREIYDDVVGSSAWLPADQGAASWLYGKAVRANSLWKLSKVALNPPTQVRNFVSNGILLHLSGVPFVKVPIRVAQAITEIKNNGKYWQMAKRNGINQSTFSAQELARIEQRLLRVKYRNNPFYWLMHAGSTLTNFAGDMYGLSEAVFKTAKIIDEIKRGKTEEEAVLEAQKWLLDYSLVTPTVRHARNAPIGMPFITFTYKSTPLVLEALVKRPWSFAPYFAIPAIMTAMVALEYDVDFDDLEKLKKALPEWLQRRGNAYILPYKDEAGRWQYADFGYFFPWSPGWETGSNLAKGEIMEATRALGIGGAPLTQLIAAVLTNVDPFREQEIADPSDPPARQLASWLNFLWRMSGPTWITDQGAVKKTWDAYQVGTGERAGGYRGEPGNTMTQALWRFVGVNIYPINPRLSRARNIAKMKARIQDIKRRRGTMARDKRLTAEERRVRINEYNEMIRAESEQLREYAKESQVPRKLR